MITTISAIVRGDASVFPPYLYEAYRSTIRRAPALPLVDVPLTLSELTGPGPAIRSLSNSSSMLSIENLSSTIFARTTNRTAR